MEKSPCLAHDSFVAVAERPWFLIYNRYYGPSRTFRYVADPFPTDAFPQISPWEDCVILAHSGCDDLAKRAGWDDPVGYLLARIKMAATGR